MVPMAHPYRLWLPTPDTVKQRAWRRNIKQRPTKFATCSGFDPPPMGAVGAKCKAPAQDRSICGARGVSAAATEFGPPERIMPLGAAASILAGSVVGQNFGIDPGLTHSPRNQLRHLRAKIDNQYRVRHYSILCHDRGRPSTLSPSLALGLIHVSSIAIWPEEQPRKTHHTHHDPAIAEAHYWALGGIPRHQQP